MHAWINITHPGFSGRQDMPDDGDQWVSWEQMVAMLRAKGNADGLAAQLAREVVELRGEVAKLKQAPAVVVTELTNSEKCKATREWFMQPEQRDYNENDPVVNLAFMAGMDEGFHRACHRIACRAISADRVLGEGMVAVRRFAERCAQRDHQPDEHIGSAKCVACEAEDALRASQGGAEHGNV